MHTSVGIHIKTRDRVAVLDAVRAAMEAEGLEWLGGGPDGAPRDAVRMLLLPPRGGWTTLYPEEAQLASDLPSLLALQLKATVFTVGRLDDAAFFYRYHGPGGELVDQYHSCPDYAKDVDEDDASQDELDRTRGEPAKLAPLLSGSVSSEQLAALLAECRIERLRDHSAYKGPGDNTGPLTTLAEALGLPDLLEDFDELWHLGADDEEEVDLRYLAYGTPDDSPSARELLSRLRTRVRSVFAGREQRPEAPEDAIEPGEEEAES